MALSPNDSGSSQGQPVTFTSRAADRIAKVVRQVEQGDRNQLPASQQGAFLPQRLFKIATFTGEWKINFTKNVTFKNQTATPNTANVVNLFWPVPEGPARDCAIAREGTAWYLLVPTMYLAHAATSATITTASLEFKTLPVAALATHSTITFSVSTITCTT